MTASGAVLEANAGTFNDRLINLRYLLTEEEEAELDASRPGDLGVWWSKNPVEELMPQSLQSIVLVRRDGTNFNRRVIASQERRRRREAIDDTETRTGRLPNEIREQIARESGLSLLSSSVRSAGQLFDHTAPPVRQTYK